MGSIIKWSPGMPRLLAVPRTLPQDEELSCPKSQQQPHGETPTNTHYNKHLKINMLCTGFI